MLNGRCLVRVKARFKPTFSLANDDNSSNDKEKQPAKGSENDGVEA
jgi:hypothetical protein